MQVRHEEQAKKSGVLKRVVVREESGRKALVALALAALPLLFATSDALPASLHLPPFEEEVYLSVTAKWAPDDCVDVGRA